MVGVLSVSEGYIPFKGYQTWYRIVGDGEVKGKLPLLALHGGPGASHDYLESLDVSLAIEAGQFWLEDRGAKASATFNFGDTQLSVYVQDTDVQMLGIGISVPLTPRRDMRPAAVQFKGSDNWRYNLTTRTDFAGSNPLAPLRGYRPGYLRHLEDTYFNNDRLTLSYVRANMLRLRTAFSELAR